MTSPATQLVELELELGREHALLRRLERLRRLAVCELGALGTPGLDANIADTQASIAQLQAQLDELAVDGEHRA